MRLTFCLLLFLLSALMGCGTEKSSPLLPVPPPFEERLAASAAAETLAGRGLALDWPSYELVGWAEAVGAHAARVPLTDGSAALFFFDGSADTVTTFRGFRVGTDHSGLLPSLFLESFDGNHRMTSGIAGDSDAPSPSPVVWHAPGAPQTRADEWDSFFACVSDRFQFSAAGIRLVCGVSAAGCFFGVPLTCPATVLCIIYYVGPCFLDIAG